MTIPKKLAKENRKYKFVKNYNGYARYQERSGYYECFTYHELGLVKEKFTMKGFAKNPDKVKI